MDVAVPLLVTHLLFFSHSGISMTLQSSETNPSTTAHVWVCRLPDEAWSPRYLAPWGMWSTPVSQPKERSGMKLLLPWSFLTTFQISNALTFGPLIHHFIIYEILSMECSLINFFFVDFFYEKNRTSAPISTVKKLRSFLKLQTPVQAELLSCSHSFSKKYTFLAFRAKVLCSEPNKHPVRMGLAGESREHREKGAQGMVDLWPQSSVSGRLHWLKPDL